MPDRLEVERALEGWRKLQDEKQPRVLRFVASGESSEEPADTARRAGEIVYEPRTWR